MQQSERHQINLNPCAHDRIKKEENILSPVASGGSYRQRTKNLKYYFTILKKMTDPGKDLLKTLVKSYWNFTDQANIWTQWLILLQRERQPSILPHKVTKQELPLINYSWKKELSLYLIESVSVHRKYKE